MRKEYKIIIGLLVLGAVIAVMTAHPESGEIVEQRAAETYSDIFFTYTVIKYPSSVEILSPTDAANYTMGINVDTNRLNFGVVVGGDSTVKRQINLTTKDGKNSRIHVKSTGQISPLLSFDKTDFVFNNKANIFVTLNSRNFAAGNYTGEIDIVIQKSNNDILRLITGY